ncbi:MAG: 3'-5' exonuclease, partial [Candidatus Dormibacteraceae bacterium]
MTDSKAEFYLKPRDGTPVAWSELEASLPETTADLALDTPLAAAQFVAVDLETTGNTPFWVLEIGAQRFTLTGSIAIFDTLIDCRAPINPYARERHGLDRQMLQGAPGFSSARRAFLRFAQGAALVEHSHDAFDSFLLGRGLPEPLPHPVFDTSTLARLVLDLPPGQTPGLSRVVEKLELEVSPEHAALGDAAATAAVFVELLRQGQKRFGWRLLADVLEMQERKPVDRSALLLPNP